MHNQNTVVDILSAEWKKSGVEEGDVLLVHSSISKVMRKLKKDFGLDPRSNDVLTSLLQTIGPSGTLLLPLFNFDFGKTKTFDIRNTPSHMGDLTEAGRKHPEAIRTGHPIYSFAVIGKHANKFKGLKNYSGYGANSPFSILHLLDGKIAVIGLPDQQSMTSYHFVEEMNDVDYRYHKKFEGYYTDFNGKESFQTFGLFVRNIGQGIQTDVNRMMELLWQKNLYKGFRPKEGFGMRTIRMRDFYQEVDSIIKSGQAINYLYSVQKITEA